MVYILVDVQETNCQKQIELCDLNDEKKATRHTELQNQSSIYNFTIITYSEITIYVHYRLATYN